MTQEDVRWIAPRMSRSVHQSGDVMAYAFGFPRSLRIESPRISMRWSFWTSRSRMPSASVGSLMSR